ncbi:MAG TPA: hypothetical protein VKB50_20635, partial [Vicinamibacterales bacterium]|nr:hypothetical protein [Vicinamibacterales bacterium]
SPIGAAEKTRFRIHPGGSRLSSEFGRDDLAVWAPFSAFLIPSLIASPLGLAAGPHPTELRRDCVRRQTRSMQAHLGYDAGCVVERVAAGGASPLAAQAPSP